MSAAVIYLTELDLTRLENAAVRAGSVTALSEAVTEDRPLEMDLRRLTACIEHGSLLADEPGGQS